ncbi:recombinase family protein [Oceanibacterium hippocampi]|uniref:DNA-invertase hin n=1 Tax=Oceanibacterium hippocampi TaxID=745714 RepID=A0A1Y5TXA5_9PROT|nr:recombinase family protein [Oceanibacterium hippocampi]SLN72346.1 DNA-invertase hin [Oceanibacterium hippocampi]
MPRCAIYTRKSSEEGLEQDFNSLQAQREACEAYVRSQRQEGWRLVRTRFDDGGYSGGSIARPALQHLLEAVSRREIDIVVVYKVDRLTRSLADFAKIVEHFDASGVSFVSVTQQFNTTTSMGRLTLNVLLSFAQFEREVTAERIRDKIAASKQKGMWMGGPVPLGYDVRDRKLQVNEDEAGIVRCLYALYLELGSVRLLKMEADRRGIRTKRRTRRSGQQVGGLPFTRGGLYQLLANPIHAGRVSHRGKTYPGQHQGIVDVGLWNAVQERLKANSAPRHSGTNVASPALLAGLLHDETGARLSPTHAVRNGKRYRYYVSRPLTGDMTRSGSGWRVPAPGIEATIVTLLTDFLGNPRALWDAVGAAPNRDHSESGAVAGLIAKLTQGEFAVRRTTFERIVRRIDLSETEISVSIDRGQLAALIGAPGPTSGEDASYRMIRPMEKRRRGVERKIVLTGPTAGAHPDPVLCRTIARAHRWMAELASGVVSSVDAIAEREQQDGSDVSRLLPLAFLAPDIVEAILDGRQPPELTARSLRALKPIPADWAKQRDLLGFPLPA